MRRALSVDKGMFSLLELKAPTDRLQSECDVRFICVKNEKLCKIRKRYYSKKRKENSNYGFLSVFLRGAPGGARF